MNYIKSLQQQLTTEQERITLAEQEIQAFRSHLRSPKFTGTENGERKDWISTGDVERRLQIILDNLREHEKIITTAPNR